VQVPQEAHEDAAQRERSAALGVQHRPDDRLVQERQVHDRQVGQGHSRRLRGHDRRVFGVHQEQGQRSIHTKRQFSRLERGRPLVPLRVEMEGGRESGQSSAGRYERHQQQSSRVQQEKSVGVVRCVVSKLIALKLSKIFLF